MCTLTRSVRWLEDFFRAYPNWRIALAQNVHAIDQYVFTDNRLWNDIFAYRFDFYPRHDETPAWSILLESERMMTALRVIERRLKRR